MPREGIQINNSLLRALRNSATLSREELAEKVRDLGVPFRASSILNVESGRRNPSPKVLDALCHILGVTRADLVVSSDDRQAETLRRAQVSGADSQ